MDRHQPPRAGEHSAPRGQLGSDPTCPTCRPSPGLLGEADSWGQTPTVTPPREDWRHVLPHPAASPAALPARPRAPACIGDDAPLPLRPGARRPRRLPRAARLRRTGPRGGRPVSSTATSVASDPLDRWPASRPSSPDADVDVVTYIVFKLILRSSFFNELLDTNTWF
jgi:hypothetical protein